MQAPVIFEAPVAASLLSHFVTAASGGNLYRKASFLLDTLGLEIFSPLVNISENPHVLRGLASGPFDGEGVASRQRCVVQDGVLQGYFLGSYSARKLGMKTTGNSGHSFNLNLRPTTGDLSSLIRQMRRGLVVTELMGQGVNLVNGDYSRGAAGYWVENGEIAYPVTEVTIAGNLKDIFRGIVAVGSDVLYRGSNHCGSILVEEMIIGGQ
jgi:PmbA protein